MDNNLVLLSINNNIYKLNKKAALSAIKIIEEETQKNNTNMLIALEKNNVIEMRKDVYESIHDLHDKISEWTNLGFKVYYSEVWYGKC